MRKVLSWIFAILSLILLIVFVVFLILFIKTSNPNESFAMVSDYYMPISMNGLFGAIITGTAGHLLAKGKGFPYYVTFPTYGVVFILIFLAGVVKFLFYKLIGHAADFPSPKKEEKPIYIVIENGLERRLTLFEANCRDYGAPNHNNYGAFFNRFKDDIGNFWRSYDKNKSFISEAKLKEMGWII